MSDFAIRAEGLGKRYRIGRQRAPYRTIRESIATTLASPFRNTASSSGDMAWVLKDVSFEVPRGASVGIIGHNGAGKSTLLKILARITEPSSGEVALRGMVSSLLDVGTGFHPELTGRENIYLNGSILGMRKFDIERQFDAIIEFSGVSDYLDTPVKFYSAGMSLRLAFAIASHLEPDILLVDEVLAVGDLAFQKKCVGRMGDVARAGRTVLFVSHDLSMIRRFCETAIHLEKGRIVSQGPTSEVVDAYERGVLQAASNHSAAVVYENKLPGQGIGYVTKIELVDGQGDPVGLVRTCDSVTIRVHYHCEERIPKAYFVLRIFSLDGAKLVLMRSDLHANHHYSLESGAGYVDCRVIDIPLSAGAYRIGAILKIEPGDAVFREDNLGMLHIEPADIYGTGHAPTNKRAHIALDHVWAERCNEHDEIIGTK